MIFYTCLRSAETVHRQALGFTKFIDFYVEDTTMERAGLKAKNYFETRYKIGATITSVCIALQQNRNRYCFPEQIL